MAYLDTGRIPSPFQSKKQLYYYYYICIPSFLQAAHKLPPSMFILPATLGGRLEQERMTDQCHPRKLSGDWKPGLLVPSPTRWRSLKFLLKNFR